MKYHLYDENYSHKGSFQSVQELRIFLCDRKYDLSCDADLSCTFDYIKHIKWLWDITEHYVNLKNLNSIVTTRTHYENNRRPHRV